MNYCIIKFSFELPNVATKEDFLYANIEFMINTFGDYFNIKICNSLSNDKYYYLIINSHNSFIDKDIRNLIDTIKNSNTNHYKDITYNIYYDLDALNYKTKTDFLIELNNNYKVIDGILNPIIEV